MKEYDELLAEAKKRDELRKAAKMEQLKNAVNAVNMLTEAENAVLKFLNDNKEKLIGKKLFLADGSKSKVFENVLNGTDFCKSPVFACYFERSKLKLRACINGGSYDNHTYYCQYFDRIMYDVFTFDSEDKCTCIRTEQSSYKVQTIEEVLTTLQEIKDLKQEEKRIQKEILETKGRINYDLLDIL